VLFLQLANVVMRLTIAMVKRAKMWEYYIRREPGFKIVYPTERAENLVAQLSKYRTKGGCLTLKSPTLPVTEPRSKSGRA